MSTAWGYHCVTCNDSSIIEVSSAFKHQLVALVGKVDKLMDLINDPVLDLNNYPEVMGISGYTMPLCHWLQLHSGHELVLRNEYSELESFPDITLRCRKCNEPATWHSGRFGYLCTEHCAESVHDPVASSFHRINT